MDQRDIPFLSASELSRLIEKREVSPVEVVEAYLDRIDALDFKFNAYLTVTRRTALQAARKAERAIARGGYLGPMHGIPFAVKDQLWSAGVRSTNGFYLLADFVPEEDATPIANLKQSGGILLGKANLTELALGGGLERFSSPRNPWDLERSAGASSGGSGVATAAFLCATSLGEDTGGSIRFPAAWCGVVGLRPSWGRVSRYGLFRGNWSMDTVGPISRTVEDAAITLQAIAGHDPRDPYTWDTPVPDYRAALKRDIRGMRIGVMAELTSGEMVEPEIREAVLKAASLLGELGASVEEVSIPMTSHAAVINSAMGVEAALDHRDWLRSRLGAYGHNNRIGMLLGSVMPAQAYYKAQKLRSMLRDQVLKALSACDVLVCPTVARPARRIADDPIITEKSPPRPAYMTQTFALASTPAISVPCGFTSNGLPIGLQMGGRPGDEETVLRVAHAYEQGTRWHTMRPPTV
jgi:aspartyl-tRNA(Asn)/glutamyl-tRNA(Gln) amidotransferase subunit A